jgi:PIN domain nuclease of toxin-antitoxin system
VNLLLDTHVWLWSRLEPERLGGAARERLEDPSSQLWLSPVSVWETLILIERGRILVDAPPREWVERALRTFPMRECPLTNQVALTSRSLHLEHEDPADRFLAATAIVFELTLLTADARLLAATDVPTLPAA